MHMADALVSPAVAGVMAVATVSVAIYSVKKVKQDEDFKKKVPLMGVLSAFVFAAQMINFSIPGTGSSGHIIGALLLSAVLGPYAGFLSMISILSIQCLFFADGGLLALGCNIINMGFFGCFIGYNIIYKSIISKGYSKKRIMIASILSCIVSLELGAFSVVLQTEISGITVLPFSTFLLFMMVIHVVIGAVEGIATGFVLEFVYNNRADILMVENGKKCTSISTKRLIGIFLVLSIVVGGAISIFASSNPDGLEWSIGKVLGTEEVSTTLNSQKKAEDIQKKISIMPDYNFKDLSEKFSSFGTSVAGISGLAIAGLAGIGIALGVRKSKKVKRV